MTSCQCAPLGVVAEFNRDDEQVLQRVVDAGQAGLEHRVPVHLVRKRQSGHLVHVQALHVEGLMPHSPVGKVPVGRCVEPYALRVDFNRKLARTAWAAGVQVGTEDHFDGQACAFLDLLDEGANRCA